MDGRADAESHQFGPSDRVRLYFTALGGCGLCARSVVPAGSVARKLLFRSQLAWRQSPWHPCASPQPAATTLWLLRGPHGRHLRRAGADGRTRLLWLRALADIGRNAGVLLPTLP